MTGICLWFYHHFELSDMWMCAWLMWCNFFWHNLMQVSVWCMCLCWFTNNLTTWGACIGVLVYANVQMSSCLLGWIYSFPFTGWDLELFPELEKWRNKANRSWCRLSLSAFTCFIMFLFCVVPVCTEFWGLSGSILGIVCSVPAVSPSFYILL